MLCAYLHKLCTMSCTHNLHIFNHTHLAPTKRKKPFLDPLTISLIQQPCPPLSRTGEPTAQESKERTCRCEERGGGWHPSEKAMAPHSSTHAWKIPWMEEPGGLQSMGSLRVRHDRETSLSLFTFMHWRRKWQPTPVFLPGESQGQRGLVVCGGRTESDTTEAT